MIHNTYENIEVICVNDGSPDCCQAILEQYAARDHRIRVILQENRGLSAARNTGIEAASGEFIYYVDSDDWIHEQSFELLLRAAEESKADMVVGGSINIENRDVTSKKYDPMRTQHTTVQSAEEYMLGPDYRVTVWGTLYRRSKVQDVRFPDKKGVSEDNIYHVLILSKVRSISVVRLPIPLYYYFTARPDSIMKTATVDTHIRNVKWLIEELHSLKVKTYALDSIFTFLFSYSYASRFYANRFVAKQNIKRCFHELRPYMCHIFITPKLLAKALVVRYLQFAHRRIMIIRDKSILMWEQYGAEKFRNVYLKSYADL